MNRPFTLALLLVFLTSSFATTTGLAQSQTEVRRFYDRVMEEFRQKEYQAARAGFQLLLELHGSSRLASSAQFWIGECEYRLGLYDEALKSFEKVLTNYPKSQKLAGATLKVGLIYTKLGKTEVSRILLQRVTIEFPKTREAKVARKALDRLKVSARSLASE